MAIKLGELLVGEGLITGPELEEALQNQVIFGGRLGTNLIEMGLIEEGDIARILSKKLGVPHVEPDRLMDIPAAVIQLIPRDIAEKFKVVPLQQDNRRLTLAMADPSNLGAIDEIAFRTGFIIQPVIAPDVRLSQALEKYYDIAREVRYIRTVEKTQRIRNKRPTAPATPEATQPRKTLSTAPPPAAAEEEPEELTEIVEELREEVLEPDEPLTADAVSVQLAEARDREDIAELLIRYLGQEFTRGALFLVKGGTATGWRGVAGEQMLPAFGDLEIPLEEPSALKTVAESRSYYLGPVARTPFNSMMLQEFGSGVPETVLLIPLLMLGRVVGILYADGGTGPLSARVFEVQKLAAKAAMAFDILILKTKIRSM